MATFVNNGEYVEPIFVTRIEDKHGKVLARFTPERHEAISPRTAYLMLSLMQGVVSSGTGVRLNYRYHLDQYSTAIAGKTGTTQNNSDCWFMGITPKLATAIWTGGELRSIHFRNMAYGQGAAQALPIFAYMMQKVYTDNSLKFPRGDFSKPTSVTSDDIDGTYFQSEVEAEKDSPDAGVTDIGTDESIW